MKIWSVASYKPKADISFSPWIYSATFAIQKTIAISGICNALRFQYNMEIFGWFLNSFVLYSVWVQPCLPAVRVVAWSAEFNTLTCLSVRAMYPFCFPSLPDRSPIAITTYPDRITSKIIIKKKVLFLTGFLLRVPGFAKLKFLRPQSCTRNRPERATRDCRVTEKQSVKVFPASDIGELARKVHARRFSR